MTAHTPNTQPFPTELENPTVVSIGPGGQEALGNYLTGLARGQGSRAQIDCGPKVLEFLPSQTAAAYAAVNLMRGVAERNSVHIDPNVVLRRPDSEAEEIPMIAFASAGFGLTSSDIARQSAAVAAATNQDLEALGSPLRLPDLR